MMRHELFEVGSYDYSDLDERLTKPVEWTAEDLKLIAENYRGGIPLTSEHDNIYVGIGNNIEYEEGKLFIEVPDELDMEGKAVAYNNISGTFYKHEFASDQQIDETLTTRWDWVHEEFGRQVRIEIKRALKAKK